MNPNPGRFFKIYFFNEAEFSNFLFYAYFYAKTLDLGLESKKKIKFLVDIFPLGSAYFCGSESRNPKSY